MSDAPADRRDQSAPDEHRRPGPGGPAGPEAGPSRPPLRGDRDRLRLLLEINNALVTRLDLRELLQAIAEVFRGVIHQEYTSLSLLEQSGQLFVLHALDFPASKGHIMEELIVPFEEAPASRAVKAGRAVVSSHDDLLRFGTDVGRRLIAEGLRSHCAVPLVSRQRTLGTLNVGRLQDHAFSAEDVELLEQVGAQIALAVDNALAYREIARLTRRLTEEKLYLEDELRNEGNFSEIVGTSLPIQRVLRQVELVAPTDSAVLIHGETGTGKELIARAIHNLSGRRERTFVKVNCAAIPTGLLESELFGHERGAFTGAIAQRVGRFELAHRGTLFLDEVGDIPLELQPKLLRVLQEQEFERLGSTKTVRVDVRIVAATNRDLARMVADRGYRSDLFYRLNVFPVTLPALRERAEDIPLLVRYFVGQHARRLNRPIQTIPAAAMAAMARYPWPGNVRELSNFIERAVLLSRGPNLEVQAAELRPSSAAPAGGAAEGDLPATLADAERDHILGVLRQTKWRVGGAAGAAARLGMKRTTLQSKMRKLGIERPR